MGHLIKMCYNILCNQNHILGEGELMYLSFKDVIFTILKAFILTTIFALMLKLCLFNYNLGIICCNLMDIPKDLALTIMSSGMAIDITVILLVVETVILYFVVKNLKRIKLFAHFLDFLSLDC